MVKSSKGIRKRSRGIMRKSPRDKGMPAPTKSFTKYNEGDVVSIVIESSVHGGQPHVRFQGTTGVITGMQGKAYIVTIKSGNMKKELIVGPEHLKKQER